MSLMPIAWQYSTATSFGLRSPGNGPYEAAGVGYEGGVFLAGEFVNEECGVRPALWLKID